MTSIDRVARACVVADREFLFVNALVGVTAAAAAGLLVHYGSFARALAALGLSPAI